MDINRRPSSTLKLGKKSYEVYKDTELFNELKSLDKNYSKIKASLGEVKVLGTDNFESMFKQSIISLNYINDKNRNLIDDIVFPHYHPYIDSNRYKDSEYCRLEFLCNLIFACNSFAELYMQVEKNTDSPILVSFHNLKYKIYEAHFLKLIDINNLYLDLDLYHWLIETGLMSKSRQIFPFDEKYIYTKDISEHFKNNGKYIVEKIRDSVQQEHIKKMDYTGSEYLGYYKNIAMKHPLNDKFASLVMEVNRIISSLN